MWRSSRLQSGASVLHYWHRTTSALRCHVLHQNDPRGPKKHSVFERDERLKLSVGQYCGLKEQFTLTINKSPPRRLITECACGRILSACASVSETLQP